MDRMVLLTSRLLLGGTGFSLATAALAMPPDLPVAVSDDLRLYVLIGSGVLLFAALVMRMLRKRADDDAATIDGRTAYGMRFFPSDRPIALE